MTNYASQGRKAVNKVQNQSRFNDLREGAASIANSAQSFLKDTTDHVGEMACESTKFIKNEGKRNLERAEGYVKAHPRKSAAYAVGLGALLSYFLLRRK